MYQQTETDAYASKSRDLQAGSYSHVAAARRRGRVQEPTFITGNPHMLELMGRLERLAAVRATVLIQGKSGTGKGVLARFLHHRSPRRSSPFVQVNCAALPEGVLESELFGHERGAFTGAMRQRAGRFELADGGTLFLDEIGAADAKVQLRLLRVLQESAFERVGGTQTLTVDVRVVAATNADLEKEIAERRFREDLFYRLNVVPVRLPPLRERPEDIPLLAAHFIDQACRRNGQVVDGISREALDRLRAFPWPGNVRQLENAIEQMVVLGTGQELTVADIPAEIAAWREEDGMAKVDEGSFQEARDRFERHFLCQALRRHRGVITQVAESIGMSRKNLYMKLEHLRIDIERFRC